MSIKAEEISSLIKQQLEHYDDKLDIEEVGVVTYVGDGIARAHGLNSFCSSTMVPTVSPKTWKAMMSVSSFCASLTTSVKATA